MEESEHLYFSSRFFKKRNTMQY